MACYCKEKGRSFEKAVAEDIREALDLEETDVTHCRGGKTEPDVQLSCRARELYPFHTECKNQKTLRIPAWWRQSKDEAGKLKPTLVFKIHGSSQKYIMLKLEDWLKEVVKALDGDQRAKMLGLVQEGLMAQRELASQVLSEELPDKTNIHTLKNTNKLLEIIRRAKEALE